ncbi:MAG: PAP/fibrillin family protein [Pleurocapsa sp. MO_192.B19]|nr:PAP/fibrillin family protein [Pleurocapsa sp. MO_192.B19]
MSNKAELLEAIAGKNRGLLANEIDNVRVLSAIQQLEDTNPTKQPLEAKDLLNGDWRLLYTTSKGILGLDRFPLFKMGQIYQCIRVSEAKVYNIAEIIGLPMLEGLVSVCATFEPVSEHRVNVIFERSIIGLQRLFGYNTPGKFIQQIESGKKFLPLDFKINRGEQQGWLETTYLDQDMRIGRGNEGNVFVLTKENSLS